MLLHVLTGDYFYTIPKSSICSFHEYGKVVSSSVSDSVHGAFPVKMASTIGGASKARRMLRQNMIVLMKIRFINIYMMIL